MKSDQSYQWDADDYTVHSTAQKEWAEELIQKLHLMGNESVLDVGCGDGKITAAIAALVPDGCVLGIDSSENMISSASRHLQKDQIPNLSFQVLDVNHLDHVDKYHIVFSNAALHWCVDHQNLLNRIRASLKPGGRMLLQMGGKGNAEGILRVLDELMPEPEWVRFFSQFTFPYGFYDPEQYKKWLGQAGFEIRRIELIPKNMCQNGSEGLAGWIRTTWLPYLNRIPLHLQTDFINELIERYLRRFPADNNGIVHVRMVRLEVEAILAG